MIENIYANAFQSLVRLEKLVMNSVNKIDEEDLADLNDLKAIKIVEFTNIYSDLDLEEPSLDNTIF